MKRLLVPVVVAVAVVGAFAYGQSGSEAPRSDASSSALAQLRRAAALDPCPTGVGDLPALTLPCLGGGPDVRLNAAPTGVPTLVNIYGSWCGPCQEEMPLLAAFSRKAAGRVALLGVDTEDDPALALRFAKDVGQHWPAVVDDAGVVLRRYSSGPPVTLFVDARGQVAFVQRGKFTSLVALELAVAKHLGVQL